MLLFTKVYPRASDTRRAILSASLPINLEIAIVFIGVLPYASRYPPGNRFWMRSFSTESSIPGRSCQACKREKSPDIARRLDVFPLVEIRISYGNREKEERKNVLRDFPWILSRAEIEFAKEEEDSDSEVLEGTEAAGVGLYRLDAFSDCIGEPVMMIVKQIKQVTLKHLGRSDHPLEAAAHCNGPTQLEKAQSGPRIGTFPRNGEIVL
jgi:hypothetical protein